MMHIGHKYQLTKTMTFAVYAHYLLGEVSYYAA